MTEWIVIRHWPRYQHYADRDPSWIKDHRSQHSSDEYLELSFHLRGLLKDLRLAYADTDGILPLQTQKLSRRLGQRVRKDHIEALNHAGFLDIVASKPLALTRSREKSREEKRQSASANPPKRRKPVDAPRANAAAYEPFRPDPPVDLDPAGVELLKEWLKR